MRLAPREDRRGSARAGGLAIALATLAVVFTFLPLLAIALRVPLGRFLEILRSEAVVRAVWLSVVSSVVATLLVVALGTPLAYLLARKSFRGKRLLEVLVDFPMVLPPTVAGVGLLLAFGRMGLVGVPLDRWFGIAIPFTLVAVVMAQAFMAGPFYVNAARAGFELVDPRLIAAAATLRADESATFFRVVLPLAGPALLSGASMTLARALGEFGATITFAGNLPGVTQTMPLAVYVALQSDRELAIAMSFVLLLAAFFLLLAPRIYNERRRARC